MGELVQLFSHAGLEFHHVQATNGVQSLENAIHLGLRYGKTSNLPSAERKEDGWEPTPKFCFTNSRTAGVLRVKHLASKPKRRSCASSEETAASGRQGYKKKKKKEQENDLLDQQ